MLSRWEYIVTGITPDSLRKYFRAHNPQCAMSGMHQGNRTGQELQELYLTGMQGGKTLAIHKQSIPIISQRKICHEAGSRSWGPSDLDEEIAAGVVSTVTGV